MADVQEYLRRYTNLPALIYLLSKKRITLLDPRSWDDSNDSHYLAVYREKAQLETVLALCFTESGETYHHWRVFANGSAGACICFKKSELLKAITGQMGVRTGLVRYLTLKEVKSKKRLRIRELPFLKRYAFEHEMEFRVIYETEKRRLPKLDIRLPLSCIDRIILSPWLHPSLSGDVKRMLKTIPGCNQLEIYRSTLIANATWKNFAEKAK